MIVRYRFSDFGRQPHMRRPVRHRRRIGGRARRERADVQRRERAVLTGRALRRQGGQARRLVVVDRPGPPGPAQDRALRRIAQHHEERLTRILDTVVDDADALALARLAGREPERQRGFSRVVLPGLRRAVLGPVVHPDLVRRRTVQRECEAQPPVVLELLPALGVRHRHPGRVGILVEDLHVDQVWVAEPDHRSHALQEPIVDHHLFALDFAVGRVSCRVLVGAGRLSRRDCDFVRDARCRDRDAHILAQRLRQRRRHRHPARPLAPWSERPRARPRCQQCLPGPVCRRSENSTPRP